MKDGKFEVDDKIECVKLDFNALITRGNKYTVKNVWNEAAYQSIQIANDSNIDTTYPAYLFKLAKPIFEHKYFSALNEKDALKYVNKVMEFADTLDVRNNTWEKGIFEKVMTKCDINIFKSKNHYFKYWQFCRTCPETFQKKMVKRTVERWVNIYKNGDEHSYRYFEDAMADRDNIECIACIHLRKEYEVEE